MRYSLGRAICEWNGDVLVRITQDLRRSVVFFGKPSIEGITYGGTGFLVVYMDGDLPCPYLVTARHVAEELKSDFVIRSNLKEAVGSDDDSETVHTESVRWSYHPDESVDIAAAHFGLSIQKYDQTYIDLSLSAERKHVFAGDPVSIVGLFRLHFGSNRNLPIVHTGNVALLADPYERVPLDNRKTGKRIETECYLVEAQTLEGLSGSPAFVREIVTVPGITNQKGDVAGAVFGEIRILGLYVGAWDGKPGSILAADRNLSGNQRVPLGMGMVVPADKILELIVNDEKLKERRVKWRQARERHRSAAKTDSAFSSDPPASDENPNHLEDFTNLLNAAARKPAPKD
jgi:hypothetical protein